MAAGMAYHTPPGVEADPSVTDVPIAPTALDPDQQDRVREAMRKLRKKAPNQATLGRTLRVKQQSISRVLAGGAVGVRLATAVARATGQSLEELLEGRPAPRLFADVEGWEVSAAVVVADRRAPVHAVRAVAKWPAFLHVEHAEPRLVVDLVTIWLAWTPREEREAAEASEPTRDPTMTPAAGTQRVPTLSERRPKHSAEHDEKGPAPPERSKPRR